MGRAARSLALALACCVAAAGAPPAHKLLVVSVDGLDWRYLRDRDRFGLRIVNLRKVLREGRYAEGVVGVWPTITWPSHTSLITGVRPDQHGIEGNRRPRSEGGDYYWSVNLLKAPTLWKAAGDRGWTTASVTWPVTAGASITWNLPEFFRRRNGGSMDLDGIQSKATPGLADAISTMFPSFPQQWMDDRTRTLAALYLLRSRQPDLVLVHLVDLDSEQHDQGPFAGNAFAVLERTDELIGQLLEVLPQAYDFVLVSDHGFERVDRIANVPVLLEQNAVTGPVASFGGILSTTSTDVAEVLRHAVGDPQYGIGREIPRAELERFAPALAGVAAAFEPAGHVMFGPARQGSYWTPPAEKGNHGFWPLRRDYRSVFLVRGRGIAPGAEPEIDMLTIAGRLAALMGLDFPDERHRRASPRVPLRASP